MKIYQLFLIFYVVVAIMAGKNYFDYSSILAEKQAFASACDIDTGGCDWNRYYDMLIKKVDEAYTNSFIQGIFWPVSFLVNKPLLPADSGCMSTKHVSIRVHLRPVNIWLHEDADD